MDSTTASGMTANDAAKRVFEAILRDEKDCLVGDAQIKVAYFLRFALPSVYFRIMEKRALKEKNLS